MTTMPIILNGAARNNGASPQWDAAASLDIEAEGINKSVRALQVNPWILPDNGGLNPTLRSNQVIFEYNLATIESEAESSFTTILNEYKGVEGDFPPYAYIDNDRFNLEDAWWQQNLDGIFSGATHAEDFRDLTRTAAQHSAAAGALYLAWLTGMRAAREAVGATTMLGGWGLSRAARARTDAYFDDFRFIDPAVWAAFDFVTVDGYLTNGMTPAESTPTEQYEWTERAVRALWKASGRKPTYAALRAVLPDDTTTGLTADQWTRSAAASRYGNATGVMLWENVSNSASTTSLGIGIPIIEAVFQNERYAMTQNNAASNNTRLHTFVEPFVFSPIIDGLSSLPAGSGISAVATVSGPDTDPANGRWVLDVTAEELQWLVSLESQGNENATINFLIIGWRYGSGGDWEPYLLGKCQATLGTATDTSTTWRQPDNITITNDYTLDESIKVVGETAGNSRCAIAFDLGGFRKIEFRYEDPSAGTNKIRGKYARLT